MPRGRTQISSTIRSGFRSVYPPHPRAPLPPGLAPRSLSAPSCDAAAAAAAAQPPIKLPTPLKLGTQEVPLKLGTQEVPLKAGTQEVPLKMGTQEVPLPPPPADGSA